ncbi:hypothetical protein LXL04_006257 [Taraxacum kok-saghyz]
MESNVMLNFMKLKLGSPPQEFNVQIDTGIDVLWVTCSSCTDCPQSSGFGVPLNFFDAGSSSTASTNQSNKNQSAESNDSIMGLSKNKSRTLKNTQDMKNTQEHNCI